MSARSQEELAGAAGRGLGLNQPRLDDSNLDPGPALYACMNRTNIVANGGVYRTDTAASVADLSLTSKTYMVNWLGATQNSDSVDAASWCQTGTFVDHSGWFGITFPAGTWFSLPRGRYDWNAEFLPSANMTTTKEYPVFFDFCTDPTGTDNQTFVHDGLSTVDSASRIVAGRVIAGGGLLVIADDDTAVTCHFRVPPSGGIAGLLTDARLNLTRF